MAQKLNLSSLKAFEEVAGRAAAYLDACDSDSRRANLDPDHYQQCAGLLVHIFGLFDARQNFLPLLTQSPAAREIAESVRVGRLLQTSCLVYYPQVAAALGRAAAEKSP
ncbi:MAG: hypothetical protein L6Q55_00150 [Azonexus sp.]|nr:hypothetical protein [Azonexus sp.]MCK6410820.1 hypothetical protein [Azonexus sp.]